MLGMKRDSNLLFYCRFGIALLLMGGVATVFSVQAVQQFGHEGGAWLALTLSVTMTGCGLGAILYGWWLDRRHSKAAADRGESGETA